ncbi:unnamed protein product, partial [Closterium sp. Naga37s-1]
GPALIRGTAAGRVESSSHPSHRILCPPFALLPTHFHSLLHLPNPSRYHFPPLYQLGLPSSEA